MTRLNEMLNQNIRVVARNPLEMKAANRDLVAWALKKVESQKQELCDAEENLRIARAAGFKTDSLERAVNIARQRVNYYRKIHRALDLGFYIVPNFPVDVFAIRTTAPRPRGGWSQGRWNRFLQSAKLLPEGEGRYVSPQPSRIMTTEQEKKKDGTMVNVDYFKPDEFRDIEFPFAFARPEVLRATTEAMSSRVFDQMGVLPARRRQDPIVVGQLLDPRDSFRHKCVSFLVAWWLDTEIL